MSHNERAESAATTQQQQRRSRRLVVVSNGCSGMTNTRPRQQTSAIGGNGNGSQRNGDNNNSSNNNSLHSSPEYVGNSSSSDVNESAAASTSAAAATAIYSSTASALTAATVGTAAATATAPSAPATTLAAAAMQAKTRSKIIRRTTEPKVEDIRLVRMVKLYPFLYDRTNDKYGKKKSSEQTWEIISQAMSQEVATCKDRWRNIRAAYMRSIDCYKTQNGPNRSKEYYLKHELTFLKECVEKQKAKGIVAIHDSSSNDADSDVGTSSSLISVIDNTQSTGEANEMENAQQQQQTQPQPQPHTQPRLVPRPTSQLIETPTTSHNQYQQHQQHPPIEHSSRATICAVPAAHCNGFQSTLARAHGTQQATHPVPIPIQLPIQYPLQLPPPASGAFQRAKLFTLTEQHERADAAASGAAEAGAPPAKRRRYYEYDEKNDVFKRVQCLNAFDKWSEDDSEALFVKSLYLKMRKLNEDQSLRFQCLALNALREVQNNNNNNTPNVTPNAPPKSTPATASTSMTTLSSASSSAASTHFSTPNAHSTLRLDHLSEEQRLQIQQFAQQVASSEAGAARATAHALTNGHVGESGAAAGASSLRRADLSSMVMVIKNEPFDSGHLSN